MHNGWSNKTLEDKSEINHQNKKCTSHQTNINHNSSDNKNVDVVVTKYKRAAAFLWTVLHAQGCQLPTSECPFQGCSDTKRLVVHIQSCAACPGQNCPVAYDGCHQARKLIGHYRECRKRQRTQRKKERTSHCLLCTLLGRHKPIRIRRDRSYEKNSEGKDSNLIVTEGVSHVVNPCGSSGVPVSPLTLTRSLSATIMPPPPPRPRTASLGSIQFSHSSPMSMCALSLSDSGEEIFSEKNNSTNCRARSGSLDNRKVNAKPSNFAIDPTVEAHLTYPTMRNETIRSCESPTSNLPIQDRCRRRSLSCSNMSSGGDCDTILEESSSDDMHHR